ncbi:MULTISPECIES: DotH/IcmK family type IV secretion protein [unclassified Xanthobacter]|uniref:DotH/IcmK family type IV secretion protein n=1 Tax=unclassified Xanthobacter TaxID=2623496 RepID=UPI001F40DD81|nr:MULTISPECIES: DotH/IcmK family type IV secretion protein [unclassified Xanthobacter]
MGVPFVIVVLTSVAAYLGAAVAARAQGGPMTPQPGFPSQGQPVQGQVIYSCPQGYVCTPNPQPGNMPPRPMTQAELDAVRAGIVRESQGAVLTPAEIGQLRDSGLLAQSAANWPGLSKDSLPEPAPRIIQISDASQRVPDKVTLAMNVVTPVTFLDKAGKPWPIAAVAYDPRTFALDGQGCGNQAAQQQGGATDARPTTINLMPCRYQTFGNVAVTLEGLATPIVLIAQSGFGAGKLDLPVTVRLTGASPASAAQARQEEAVRQKRALMRAYSSAPAVPRGVDPELDAFVAGVPPKGADRIDADMSGLSAWMYGGRLYLRGPVQVIHPEFDAMGAGADGVFVWRFSQPIARIRVVLDGGVERTVTLGL